MWSFMLLVLLAPALVTAGLTEAHLRRAFEQRVRESMVIECDKYVPRDRREEIADAGMGTVACLYDTFDYSKFFEQMVNGTTTEEVMVPVGDFCKHRKRLQGCFHQFLVGMAPCAPPSVRVQVESMKLAVTELFSYFCNDDSDRVRRFMDDGGLQCIQTHKQQGQQCTANMTDLFSDFPVDTGSFQAIDACYKYDDMTTCILNKLSSCPHASTAEFINDIFTLLRKGTYCHVTAPKQTEPSQSLESNNN